MYKPLVYLSLLFFFAQFSIGCWPSMQTRLANASLSDIASIDITIHDNYYGDQDTNLVEPPVWRLPSGADTVATVSNEGNLTHNWAIIKQGFQIPVPFNDGQSSDIIEYGAGMIYGQNRTTMTFTAPTEVGEYLVICTVAGHYPSMQGRLVVE